MSNRPLPSRSTETEISVSFVLRLKSAERLVLPEAMACPSCRARSGCLLPAWRLDCQSIARKTATAWKPLHSLTHHIHMPEEERRMSVRNGVSAYERYYHAR